MVAKVGAYKLPIDTDPQQQQAASPLMLMVWSFLRLVPEMQLMRYVQLLLIALCLASCATVDFQPYEAKNNRFEGEGGTKVVVDGVEIWANGSPPRKYSIIGMISSEVGSGIGDEAIIRSATANEVKKRGGSAAIQVNNNSSFAGVVRTAPGFYMATGVKRMQFAVIRYVE